MRLGALRYFPSLPQPSVAAGRSGQCVCVCLRAAGGPGPGHDVAALPARRARESLGMSRKISLPYLNMLSSDFYSYKSHDLLCSAQLGQALRVYEEVSVRHSRLSHSAMRAALALCREGAGPGWLCDNLWRITVDRDSAVGQSTR